MASRAPSELIIGIGETNTVLFFFHEIQSHLVTNPARKYCHLDRELRSKKMFVDGQKFETKNLPRFHQVDVFMTLNVRFCPKIVFQALRAVMLSASEDKTFSSLPSIIEKEFGLSSWVSKELFYSTVVGR